MSRKSATLMSWIFAFFLFSKELKAAVVGEKTLEQGNPLTILSLFSEYIPDFQEKSLNETGTRCPDLWTETEKQFYEKEETGILGSLTDIQKLCPEKSLNLSLCNAAIWISNYVCSASEGGKRQLPVIKDLRDLNNVDGLCNALVGNANLTQKLCGIMLKTNSLNSFPLKDKLEKSCNLPNGSNKCEQYCGEKNQRLCKIILQSLRTIVFWEEKKETMLKETVAIAETEATPPVTTKVTSNSASLTNVLPQQNPVQEILKVHAITHVQTVSFNATTQSTALPTAIKGDIENSSITLKITKSPSTVSTDIDSLVNTETTVTDEDFGLDDNFGSADKPPIKTADEDPQSYEVGDEVDKEEKGTDKQTEGIPVETQKTLPTYDLPSEIDGDPINTHFLFYFIAFVVLSACGYLIFMRRKYLIALVLEGRTNSSRRRSNSFRERPASGNYRKLVNNLEEAITSNSVKNSNVIY